MTISRIGTATEIINRAAIEVGLDQVVDPYSTPDKSYVQLRALINTVGEELATAYNWEFLNKSAQFSTLATDSGDYPLPDDFLFMLPQTGWEISNNVPLFGPLSAQQWTYLRGRQLASSTIYASFRLREGLISLFPQPPIDGLDINYEYQSKNWVVKDGVPTDEVTIGSDVVLFDKVLASRYLKMKFLDAKGLDSSKAMDDFTQMFSFITNVDKSAPIISAGSRCRGVPYISPWGNLPDTNYGSF